MIKHLLYGMILAGLLVQGSAYCQGRKDKHKGKLVWFDEFNTPGKPDTSRWSYDIGTGENGWGNNELQYYTDKAENARVENGLLIIEARHDSLNGKAYTSSRLVTRKKGDWVYGYIEVKAKLPKGRGTWPAIWMLSTDWSYGGWPESGEIDIMEEVGYDPNVIHGTAHSKSYNHVIGTQKEGKITIADSQDKFHVYGLRWAPTKMDFLVDDKVFHTVARVPGDDFKGWPFDKRFHLILNLAVGGNWGGKEGVDPSIWPRRMEVDYVRVYQP